MLRQRALSALVLVPTVVVAIYWGRPAFFLLMLGVSLIAAYEFCQLMQVRRYAVSTPLVLGTVALLMLAAQFPVALSSRLSTSFVLLAVSAWQLFLPAQKRSLADWALTLAGGLYLGWLTGYLILIRSLPEGREWALSTFVVVWLSDSAAYFVGSRWGKHPFAPQLSPRKTWEGSIAGWITAVATVAVLDRFLGMGLAPALLLGLVAGLAATMGDLFVSFVKRQAGVKDSGKLIPGHGGMMDRMDSLVIVAALMYHFAGWTAGG